MSSRIALKMTLGALSAISISTSAVSAHTHKEEWRVDEAKEIAKELSFTQDPAEMHKMDHHWHKRVIDDGIRKDTTTCA